MVGTSSVMGWFDNEVWFGTSSVFGLVSGEGGLSVDFECEGYLVGLFLN